MDAQAPVGSLDAWLPSRGPCPTQTPAYYISCVKGSASTERSSRASDPIPIPRGQNASRGAQVPGSPDVPVFDAAFRTGIWRARLRLLAPDLNERSSGRGAAQIATDSDSCSQDGTTCCGRHLTLTPLQLSARGNGAAGPSAYSGYAHPFSSSGGQARGASSSLSVLGPNHGGSTCPSPPTCQALSSPLASAVTLARLAVPATSPSLSSSSHIPAAASSPLPPLAMAETPPRTSPTPTWVSSLSSLLCSPSLSSAPLAAVSAARPTALPQARHSDLGRNAAETPAGAFAAEAAAASSLFGSISSFGAWCSRGYGREASEFVAAEVLKRPPSLSTRRGLYEGTVRFGRARNSLTYACCCTAAERGWRQGGCE